MKDARVIGSCSLLLRLLKATQTKQCGAMLDSLKRGPERPLPETLEVKFKQPQSCWRKLQEQNKISLREGMCTASHREWEMREAAQDLWPQGNSITNPRCPKWSFSFWCLLLNFVLILTRSSYTLPIPVRIGIFLWGHWIVELYNSVLILYEHRVETVLNCRKDLDF